MLNIAIVVLVALLYIGVFYSVKTDRIELPKGWEFEGIFLLYKTEKGLLYIDRIAQRYKSFWRPLGTLGYIMGGIILVVSSAFVLFAGVSVFLNPPESQITSPANYLVIPGVNDFLPLSVGVEILLGLLLGMVVHEGGHAILSRVEDIDLDSTGLVFISILPIGAFVEPDEESQEEATRVGRLRMFAAGITNNIILTIIMVGLLIGVGSLLISPVSGAAIGGVLDGSSLDESGVSNGEVIVEVDGQEISSNSEFLDTMRNTESRTVGLTTKEGETYEVDRELMIERSVQSDFLPSEFYDVGSQVSSIGGSEIYTVYESSERLSNIESETVSITVGSTTEEVTLGGLATVQRNSPLSNNVDSVSQGDNIVILSVNGERTQTGQEAQVRLDETDGEASVTFKTETDEVVTKEIDSDSIGAVVYPGYTGLEFTDTGVSLYPVSTFLSVTNPMDTGSSALQWIVLFFFAPFATLAGLQYNFFGFAGIASNFYESAIGAEPLVFFMLNLFFWTAWININLALFNCIPTYMLDGGHMLKDGSSVIGEKLGFEPERFSTFITSTVKMMLFFGLLSMIVAPSVL